MAKIADFIVKKKILILVVFTALTVVCGLLALSVKTNYDSTKYLPNDSKMKTGIEIMQNEFGESGSATAMVKDLSFEDAIFAKEKIASFDGVKGVVWIDDLFEKVSTNISQLCKANNFTISEITCTKYLLTYLGVLPNIGQSDAEYTNYMTFLSVLSKAPDMGLDTSSLPTFQKTAAEFYKDNAAIFQLSFIESDYSEKTMSTIEQIKKINFTTYMIGNAASTNGNIETVTSQTFLALIIGALVVFIILILLSSSFWEPILFLIIIGVAVVLNMGSNIILGDISYITKSVAAVLQLALTMDYSIFLLHRFKQEKEKGLSANEAMKNAIVQSFSPISASSLTTIASFVALMFMQYRIGFDLGLVLAKGVIFSILSVFLLLPALVILTHKLIDKTTHKTLKFEFKGLSKLLYKTRFVLPILFLVVIIPCIFLQSQNTFVYGNEASLGSEGSTILKNREQIEEIFGTQNKAVILVSKDDFSKELSVTQKLLQLKEVSSVQSLSLINTSGVSQMMPESFLAQFQSENYSRIILNLNTVEEGEASTATIHDIEGILKTELGENDYYLLGESMSAIDTKNITEKDYGVITLISMLLIALILLITFRNLLLPILLVFAIQSSIWINMAYPYLTGEPLVFIGYMIVSAILLGATIDYAILLCSNYMESRKTLPPADAIGKTVALSSKAILTSGGILTFAGFSLTFASTMPMITVFGSAIGRGGITSMIMVLILLPQLLVLFDKPIQRLSFFTKSRKEKKA